MAGLSIPGSSCCGSTPRTPQTGCTTRSSGQCVYYSGPSISALGINTGDLLDTVVQKLSVSSGPGVTSVGLTMPSAFAVANSPITSAGTLAVTAVGNTSQYVRGDGSLASFPAILTAANNGLSLSTSTVQLGGPLIKHTTVDGATRSFDFILNDIRNLAFNSTDTTRGQLNIASNQFGELVIGNTSTYSGVKIINFNTDVSITGSTGSGFTMTLPNVGNTAGPQIFGTASGVAFPFFAQVSAAQGLISQFQNTSTSSTASTAIIIQSTGASGNSSFLTFRNTSATSTDYTIGSDGSDQNFKLNSNTSGIFSSGNLLTITPTGRVGLGQTPTAQIHINASDGTAGTAPIKIKTGTLLTILELGTLEYTDNGTTGHLYFTLNQGATPTRVQII